jgi:hypothetical protein
MDALQATGLSSDSDQARYIGHDSGSAMNRDNHGTARACTGTIAGTALGTRKLAPGFR